MGLRDVLRKKDHVGNNDAAREDAVRSLAGPEFKFIRTTTLGHEVLQPPSDPRDHLGVQEPPRRNRLSLDVFRPSRSRSASASSQKSNHSGNNGPGEQQQQTPEKKSRRISERLNFSRAPPSSENVPQNLPEIREPADPQDKDAKEGEWEKRATILAERNGIVRSGSISQPGTPDATEAMRNLSFGGQDGYEGGQHRSYEQQQQQQQQGARARSGSKATTSSAQTDDLIREAIRLHETGDLAKSTRLFGQLADPNGANNALSQVLYGLALRHGWGCPPDPENAIQYLSTAASNAALVEQMALQGGSKKGGALKGELVLAIFELANCFRHGWGIERDPVAAKQYYETAANLGDTDAMNEAAWCYIEGFGCKKDKYAAAKYYRQAEKAGNKTLGNSWIWKDKYGPPEEAVIKK